MFQVLLIFFFFFFGLSNQYMSLNYKRNKQIPVFIGNLRLTVVFKGWQFLMLPFRAGNFDYILLNINRIHRLYQNLPDQLSYYRNDLFYSLFQSVWSPSILAIRANRVMYQLIANKYHFCTSLKAHPYWLVSIYCIFYY